MGEQLARALAVEVLRADGQPGSLARVDSSTWAGVAKAGVPVTFSIVSQPEGATGAAASQASPTTDAQGRAEATFTAGSLPGQYVVRASVRNACLGASLDFAIEVRQVHAVLLQLEDVAPPVRVAARGDPVVIGISTPRAPSRQRVTAVAVHEGPDGSLGTNDDLLLGPVPADWAVAGGAKNDARFMEADASGKVARTPTVTLDAGPTVGASKLAVSFTPRTGGRATRGTFGLDVVEVAFVLLDGTELTKLGGARYEHDTCVVTFNPALFGAVTARDGALVLADTDEVGLALDNDPGTPSELRDGAFVNHTPGGDTNHRGFSIDTSVPKLVKLTR